MLWLIHKWSSAVDGPQDQPDTGAAETAWRIHAAIDDWTGKADQKASFALAIQSAVALAVISMSGDGGVLSGLSGWAVGAYRAGIALLVIAIGLVIAAVMPALRRKDVDRDWRGNFIFFGHLRHWADRDLEAALAEDDLLPVLAKQLTSMSKIAWKKYRRLQASLWVAAVGTALLGLAGFLDDVAS